MYSEVADQVCVGVRASRAPCDLLFPLPLLPRSEPLNGHVFLFGDDLCHGVEGVVDDLLPYRGAKLDVRQLDEGIALLDRKARYMSFLEG